MANSVLKNNTGPIWPFGCVVVPTPGTPVRITVNIDANNNNAPESTTGTEWSVAFRSIWFAGFHQDANNNMQPNNGNIYVMMNPSGGSGNRTDAGAMVMIVQAGTTAPLPASLASPGDRFSPYKFYLDADTANDAALVTCVGPQGA